MIESTGEMARRRGAAKALGLSLQATWAEIVAAREARPTSSVAGALPDSAASIGADEGAPMHVSIGDPPIARRVGARLELVLLFAPRTKKNSKQNVATQSKAYVAFRNAVVKHLKSFAGQLGFPLPDQPYNLAATFYVDAPGERADLFGLAQGLADALQDAGTVSDDWWFRTIDGTRVVIDHARPRVELVIMPLGVIA